MNSLPRYSFYIAMHLGQPSLIVDIPSMNKFKYVVKTADSFAALRPDYMYMKNNPDVTHNNVAQYAMPAAYQHVQQTAHVG